MRTTKFSLILFLFTWTFSFSLFSCNGNNGGKGGVTADADSIPAKSRQVVKTPQKARVTIGAENLIANELDKIRGKGIAIAANHTSLLPNGTHLVDTLHSLGLDIKVIFSPEHGFRGKADAGAKVNSSVDEKTGIRIKSLYGSQKKPVPADLEGVDVIIFDIQDVGARFYTYISTMSYLMESCAERGKTMMVLDRPNPNGWYVDGPVMEDEYKSFVGLHPIPIVHGMTVAEYAKMVNGEKWLAGGKTCILRVVECSGYEHSMKWDETGLTWVAPSPNLKTEYSAYLYPMLCWYEGMPVSVGRGTDAPFEQIGAPWHVGYKHAIMRDSIKGFDKPAEIDLYQLKMELTRFVPESREGAKFPKFLDETCYGVKFTNRVDGKQLFLGGLSLLQNFQIERKNVNLTEPLFEKYFYTLTGTKSVAQMIEAEKEPEEIYQSWQRKVGEFKAIRARYLLYK